jgi:hypothetical protein
MEDSGIDIVTDGEIRRESYSSYFATSLAGVVIDPPVYPPFASTVRRLQRTVVETPLVRGDDGRHADGDGRCPASFARRWQAEGKARFAGVKDVAALEVSFFGPFYGAYNVIDLDPDYQHALVVGPDRSYLWILSRSPAPPAAVVERLVAKAKSLDFDTSKLIFVRQCTAGTSGADCQAASR